MTPGNGCRFLSLSFASIAALALLLLGGCGGGDGDSDYQQMIEDQKAGEEALKSQGAKFERRKYPQGEAWSVDLSGQTLSEEVLQQLTTVGPISELNLSGSTATDAHASKINSPEIGGYLLKLDLSKTEFSDTGLAELKDLNLLRELIVTGTKVTQAGITKFQEDRQANPNVPSFFKAVSVRK